MGARIKKMALHLPAEEFADAVFKAAVVTVELFEAIFPKRPVKTPEGKRVAVDPILELAEGCNLESLASEVFTRLKLWQRTTTEL